MSTIHLHESAVFKEEVDAIFPLFIDLKNWHRWAPWFISDPTTDLTISEDGKSLKWEGVAIGEGKLEIISEVENQSLEIKITFTSTRSIKATAVIEFNSTGLNETNIKWIYKEKMAFYKGYQHKKKASAISYDLKRGLHILSDLIHNGTVKSEVKVLGVQWGFGYDYIGINHQVPMDQMQEFVVKDFKKLFPYSQLFNFEDKPCPFILYHFWDKETLQVSFTSCISVMKEPEYIPNGMVYGKTKDTRLFAVQHVGGHRHVANALCILDYLQSAELISVNEKLGYRALEFFRYGPMGVAEDEIESDVIIPLNDSRDNTDMFY